MILIPRLVTAGLHHKNMVNEPVINIYGESKNQKEHQVDFKKLFSVAGEGRTGTKIFVVQSDYLQEFEPEVYNDVYKYITKVLLQLPQEERFIIIFFVSEKHQATPWSFIISHYYKLDDRYYIIISLEN